MSREMTRRSVPQWQCIEFPFEATIAYDNPFQDGSFGVTFTSPSGRMRTVEGFWDGGTSWRVRFAPDEVGEWTFITQSAHSSDRGLNGQSGRFECSSAVGSTAFERHGPVQLSKNRRYLEHADGTPFFWLADTAWNGPLRATQEQWEYFLVERVRQKFTAVQWVTTQWIGEPNGDYTGATAYSGTERIVPDIAYFHRMDEKARAINRFGLLSVPVLLWAAGWSTRDNNWVNPGYSLPEDQAIRLARYMIARWGAYPVVWILPGDADYRSENASRWQRIGQAVFDKDDHAPVSLHPGGMQWNMDEFGGESWLDIVGYQSGHGDDENTLAWLTSGPPATDWQRAPWRPFINLEPPYENHIAYQSGKPHDAHSVRRALYWSLLVSPTAGVTYGGHGVWGWDDGSGPPTGHPKTGTPLPWQQAMTMPGAEQLRHLVSLFGSLDWWRLQPSQDILAAQPGTTSSTQFVAAAQTENGDLTVVYTPVKGCIELRRTRLNDNVSALWFDPRTGQRCAASPQTSGDVVQVETPGNGDWLLIMGQNVYLPVSNGAGDRA